MPRTVVNEQSVLFGTSSPSPLIARAITQVIVRANRHTGVAHFDQSALEKVFGSKPSLQEVRLLVTKLGSELLRYVNGATTLVTTIGFITLNSATKTFDVTISGALRGRLDDMRQHCEAHDLTNLIAIRGNYAKALYQLLASQKAWPVTLTIEELREKLGVPKGAYTFTADLKRIVLSTALKSMALFSDLKVTLRMVKQSRKVVGFSFELLDLAQPHPTGEPPSEESEIKGKYDSIPTEGEEKSGAKRTSKVAKAGKRQGSNSKPALNGATHQ